MPGNPSASFWLIPSSMGSSSTSECNGVEFSWLMRKARSSQERELQLPGAMPRREGAVDPTQAMACQRWELSGDALVLSLVEAARGRGSRVAQNDPQDIFPGKLYSRFHSQPRIPCRLEMACCRHWTLALGWRCARSSSHPTGTAVSRGLLNGWAAHTSTWGWMGSKYSPMAPEAITNFASYTRASNWSSRPQRR